MTSPRDRRRGACSAGPAGAATDRHNDGAYSVLGRLFPDASAWGRLVVKLKRGRVGEVGIADRRLTSGRRKAARFLRRFN